MSNERIGFYEGMFLFPQSATANLQGAVDHIKGILDKAGATIKTFQKWDDRRLAYEIDGNKRGVYFLAYFNAPASSLSDLERMCNQSEEVLRMMVTKADHIPTEIIEANDGSEELATEIKLRSEKSSEASESPSSKISKKDAKESKTKDAPAEKAAPEVAEEVAEETAGEPAEKAAPEVAEEVAAADEQTEEVTEDSSEESTEEAATADEGEDNSVDKATSEKVAKDTKEETTEA